MKVDVKKFSEQLASDPGVSDYDFWRALRTVNERIFVLDRTRSPIPIQYLHLRAILREARAKRNARKPRV